MPTFVYMTSCDGCGHCVDICPSDIMHIDPVTRRAVNIEPNFCWECYSCVKACPQNAIDARGYADFAPMGRDIHSLAACFDEWVASCTEVYECFASFRMSWRYEQFSSTFLSQLPVPLKELQKKRKCFVSSNKRFRVV